MCLISAMDCIQLVIHSMIGSVLAFELSVPSYITTLGAFMGATWMLMVTTTVLLTIHRLVWTIWPMYAKKILSPRASKALLVGLATFYLLFLIWNLTPYSALVFNKKYMAWYYDPEESQLEEEPRGARHLIGSSFRRDLMNMIRSIGWDRGEQKCNRVIPIAAIQNLPKAAA
ncbi:hypothetical protein ANCCEY_01325 [Ancylostoma ceylanicum]|uniref:Uncharacterized protein n=1 Tax=Ancylostoma ceylanicum TaxID=53326 RepID=A0A0D6M646_9BILA|nr:hypothetical protein ANCCEY_01325 [Ancylostoma ceylanicum]